MIPQFTMAMYGKKEYLLEAKCAWLEGQIEWMESNLVSLQCIGYDAYTVTTLSGSTCYTGESLLDCIDQAQEKEKAND